MTLSQLLGFWRRDPDVGGNIAAWRQIPDRPAADTPFPQEIQPELADALRKSGIKSFYAHQSQAWESAMAGDNPVIVTGTASGKTLCYNLPILQRLLQDPAARALYLFPTKALAQDQEKALQSIINFFPADLKVGVATYDGDTPARARKEIRQHGQLVLSNPDMLHVGILPYHPRWVDFFRHLAFVVIDEMHAYRGVFGSHVANVIRRLKRVAHFYNADPAFFLTSATIANPEELAERLIEEPIKLITEDGSPRGKKNFLIFNPPIINPELGLRRGALSESLRLCEDLLAYHQQTIIFAGTRRAVELAVTQLRQSEIVGPEEIRGYRSGYLPIERRQIERELRQGKVRAVVATNALELGVDIGGLSAAIVAGYPGTIAATWQQVGRAGRGLTDSLGVLIVSSNPLDQFLAHHPEYFFSRSPENALIDPNNLLILLVHLQCASFELSFRDNEAFGRVPSDEVSEYMEILQSSGEVHYAKGKYYWIADQYPAQAVSLRTASAARILLQSIFDGRPAIIGEVDFESAHWMVHPGAVYLHEGSTYRVEDLDLEKELAHLKHVELDYYTEPQSETSVQIVKVFAESAVKGATKSHGEISVTSQVVGYQKIHWETRERLDSLDLDMPPTVLQTTGYWIAFADETIEGLRSLGLWRDDPNDYGPNWRQQRERARSRDHYQCQNCGVLESERQHDVHHKTPFRTFASYQLANQLENLITLCQTCHRRAETVVRVRSGLSGLAYTLGHLAPFFLMCDRRDLGIHTDPQSTMIDGKPVVVLFDHVPAGIGFSARLFELHDQMLNRAHELVDSCACEEGCPSCVGPAGEAGFGGKKETLALLSALIET